MIEPLVMLPGMMCDARVFQHQFIELSQDRAVTVAPITQGERIEEIASGLLDQLPPRFALAGLSMGGIVAMELVRRAPDRVTRLCLMDTTPLPETPQVASMREPLIVRARVGNFEDVIRETLKPEYLAPGPQRLDVLDRVVEMGIALGPEIYVRQSRALQRRPDLQIGLHRVKVPTLILCGAYDGMCPPQRHKVMADLITGAELLVLEGSGHLPTLEQPEAVTDAMRRWLDQDRPEG
ncbi:alpha/beta fold hydrolase [Primorskyibacter sp. S87]|uniref:alpha/beta fold hydrolase n=1 Tax=Primorskyibacter sp. S87 TaxID=3415126 RepID=UPI003C7C3104